MKWPNNNMGLKGYMTRQNCTKPLFGISLGWTPYILGYIPKHRKQFRIDPNLRGKTNQALCNSPMKSLCPLGEWKATPAGICHSGRQSLVIREWSSAMLIHWIYQIYFHIYAYLLLQRRGRHPKQRNDCKKISAIRCQRSVSRKNFNIQIDEALSWMWSGSHQIYFISIHCCYIADAGRQNREMISWLILAGDIR